MGVAGWMTMAGVVGAAVEEVVLPLPLLEEAALFPFPVPFPLPCPLRCPLPFPLPPLPLLAVLRRRRRTMFAALQFLVWFPWVAGGGVDGRLMLLAMVSMWGVRLLPFPPPPPFPVVIPAPWLWLMSLVMLSRWGVMLLPLTPPPPPLPPFPVAIPAAWFRFMVHGLT